VSAEARAGRETVGPKVRVRIRRGILSWARESAGIRLDAAAEKLALSSEELRKNELGEAELGLSLVRSMGTLYKRPLAAFLLPGPPKSPDLPKDFRRLPRGQSQRNSPELLGEFRRAWRRRDVAYQIELEAGRAVRPFDLKVAMNSPRDKTAEAARAWLGLSLDEQLSWPGKRDPLLAWLEKYESSGVLIFQTRRLAIAEARGFSLYFSQLPVIGLNSKDERNGKIFTLAHELIHLGLRLGGVCNPYAVEERPHTEPGRVELFCNSVAGLILVPDDALEKERSKLAVPANGEWAEATIKTIARRFSTSREVVLRRLLDQGATTRPFYRSKMGEYQAQYIALKERARQEGKQVIVPFPVRALAQNGRRFTRIVLSALERGRITGPDAADFLGVATQHFDKLGDLAGMDKAI
jgi:Zn-dependent peptidase ImmA (M78 family)